MKQLGLGLNLCTKKTRKREFLEEMERAVPWTVRVQIVEPHYPKAKTGRRPFGIETMLRIHYLQQWFGLSDPAMEEALHDVPLYREFTKLDGAAARLPDKKTILRFRHLLERHDLAVDMLRVMSKLGCLSIGTTIYRWVARDKARGGALWLKTRQLSHRYRKGYRMADHRGRMRGKRPLSERPARVSLRQEFGHWEGDTVMGKDGRHCLLTLVERTTRWTRIIKLPARQASEVNKALAREMRRGVLNIKSLTLDNGTEFHGLAELERALGIEVLFAQPYHSRERGTNENTNGLIRQ